MTDNTEDKDKIIDLAQRLKEKNSYPRGRKKGPLGATAARIEMIKRMSKEAIRENASERLTEQEKEFATLVVNGASMASAFEQAYPERCWKIALQCQHKGDQPCVPECEVLVPALSYEQKAAAASYVSKKADIRSHIMTLLAQEEEDVSHTASRLDNFIVKSLEKEANDPNNSASARIAALKALSEHSTVKVAENKAADKVSRTSAEVLDAIQERVNALTQRKNEL